MLAAVLTFSVNDVLGKWLVAAYGAGQLMVIRSLGSMVLVGPFALRSLAREGWRVERPGMQALRVALGATESFCFYWAVGHMPLADAMTFWMAAPIFVTALSALLLGERVSIRRWALVLLGFAGVVLALGGGLHGLGGPGLVALLGSVLYALFLLGSRSLRGTPDVVLAGMQMLGGFAIGAIGIPVTGWTPPDWTDLLLLLGLGLVATMAHMMVTRALKLAPASVVVPYQYSFLIWATLFGWLFFDDLPGPMTIAGGAIIVLAGLLLYREERQG